MEFAKTVKIKFTDDEVRDLSLPYDLDLGIRPYFYREINVENLVEQLTDFNDFTKQVIKYNNKYQKVLEDLVQNGTLSKNPTSL